MCNNKPKKSSSQRRWRRRSLVVVHANAIKKENVNSSQPVFNWPAKEDEVSKNENSRRIGIVVEDTTDTRRRRFNFSPEHKSRGGRPVPSALSTTQTFFTRAFLIPFTSREVIFYYFSRGILFLLPLILTFYTAAA